MGFCILFGHVLSPNWSEICSSLCASKFLSAWRFHFFFEFFELVVSKLGSAWNNATRECLGGESHKNCKSSHKGFKAWIFISQLGHIKWCPMKVSNFFELVVLKLEFAWNDMTRERLGGESRKNCETTAMKWHALDPILEKAGSRYILIVVLIGPASNEIDRSLFQILEIPRKVWAPNKLVICAYFCRLGVFGLWITCFTNNLFWHLNNEKHIFFVQWKLPRERCSVSQGTRAY
jgi:hypothetical protein